jgi:hypothetical protein
MKEIEQNKTTDIYVEYLDLTNILVVKNFINKAAQEVGYKFYGYRASNFIARDYKA